MTKQKRTPSVGPTEAELLSIGKLQFLASFCPLHQRLPALALSRVFYPAINTGCVRFFENDDGKTAAALIWARITDKVAERMLSGGAPPDESEWISGDTLWFLDVIAPFGHGTQIARHIARNPPQEPFRFARLDQSGKVQRVVSGDAAKRRGRRIKVQDRRISGKGSG